MSDAETWLLMQLKELERRYLEDVEPIIKRLAAIRAMQPPPPIIIPLDALPPEFQRRFQEQADG